MGPKGKRTQSCSCLDLSKGKTPAGFVKRGPLGPQSTRLEHLMVNIYKYLQGWIAGGLQVNIYIFTMWSQVLCTFVHKQTEQHRLICTICTYIYIRTGMGCVLPHFICGEATLFTIFYRLKWDKLSHFTILLPTGPSRASSPPGAHVRGESSHLSLAYRYLSPKIKE